MSPRFEFRKIAKETSEWPLMQLFRNLSSELLLRVQSATPSNLLGTKHLWLVHDTFHLRVTFVLLLNCPVIILCCVWVIPGPDTKWNNRLDKKIFVRAVSAESEWENWTWGQFKLIFRPWRLDSKGLTIISFPVSNFQDICGIAIDFVETITQRKLQEYNWISVAAKLNLPTRRKSSGKRYFMAFPVTWRKKVEDVRYLGRWVRLFFLSRCTILVCVS